MKKICTFLVLIISFFFMGCGNNQYPEYSLERHIYKEFYDAESSFREDSLDITKHSSRIVLNVSVSSGTIELTVYGKDKGYTKEYAYVVDGYLSEEILLDKDNRYDEWSFSVRKYEDTEGYIKIDVY